MVVGMYDAVIALLSAQDLDGTIGNDLIGIHIDGGAGTALDLIADKLIVEFSLHDLAAGLADGFADIFTDDLVVIIGQGAGHLDLRQAFDKLRQQGPSGNMKIFVSSQRLHSVISIRRNFSFSDRIPFNTIVHKTSPFHAYI